MFADSQSVIYLGSAGPGCALPETFKSAVALGLLALEKDKLFIPSSPGSASI